MGGAGNSRIDFSVVEEELRSTGIDRKRRRVWTSQSLWERGRCLEDPGFAQKGRAARDQAWNKALLSEDISKMMIDGSWHIGEYQGMVEDIVETQRTSTVKQQRRAVNTLAEATSSKQQSDESMRKAKEHYDSAWDLEILLPDELVAGAVLAYGRCPRDIWPPPLGPTETLLRAMIAPAPRFHDAGGVGQSRPETHELRCAQWEGARVGSMWPSGGGGEGRE